MVYTITFLCRIVGSFTKQMVKLAIDQLRPEFERMAGRAAEKAVDSKMMKVRQKLRLKNILFVPVRLKHLFRVNE